LAANDENKSSILRWKNCFPVNENAVFVVYNARSGVLAVISLNVMKTAAEYLQNHVFEARRPRRELQPVVAYADAVQAIDQALADAEKYKYLLMRALRRHADETAPASRLAASVASSFFADDTPVRPLYPAPERLAA
jgi:predicted S18 family serine protease